MAYEQRYNPIDFTIISGSTIYLTNNINNNNLRNKILSITQSKKTDINGNVLYDALLDNNLTTDKSVYTIIKVLKPHEKNLVIDYALVVFFSILFS